MENYLGEIRMFAGNFAPAGWLFCNGQTLSISENDALYALIGTTYGGDGQTTFQLPDLRSRLPIGQGNGAGLTSRPLGQTGGSENVTLSTNQIPSHNHGLVASSTTASTTTPGLSVIYGAVQRNANAGVLGLYVPASPNPPTPAPTAAVMNAATIAQAGNNQAHANIMPTLAVNFIIALQGIFPTQQ